MSDEKAVFTSKENGSVWYQPNGPNTKVYYLGCHTLGDLAAPQGGVTLLQCLRDGEFITLNATKAAPEVITTNIGFYVGSTLGWLEKQPCNGTLYAFLRDCGKADSWGNFVRGIPLSLLNFATRTYTGLANHTEDVGTMGNVDVEAAPPLKHIFRMTPVRQTIAESANLEDIASCTAGRCYGPCGGTLEAGSDLIATGRALAASPANKGQAWLSTNGGSTWAAATADPFANGEDQGPVVCFDYGRSGIRRIVGRGETDVAAPAEVGISDDGGITWSLVNVGSVNGKFFGNAKTLFALGADYIWAALTDGYIYFSEDAGETWTQQQAGVLTTEDFRAIHFKNERIGYAVGDNNVFFRTSDGGLNWASVTGPIPASNLMTVYVTEDGRVWVGAANGNLYYSDNEGTAWTQRAFQGDGAGSVDAVAFADKLVGFMIHNTAAPVGYVFFTVNGGWSWERLTLETNVGLSALAVVNERLAYAVGLAQGGTAVVLKISGG